MRRIDSSVAEAVRQVVSLGARSTEIGKIISVIDGIAQHTNLLALNAAIEASRAGEQGRGFAVVADDVRKLAKRTSQATQEITAMIRGIQEETRSAMAAIDAGKEQVEAGVRTTSQAGSLLQQIVESADQVGERAGKIASAVTQQSAATGEVNRNLERISNLTSDAAKGAKISASACRDVSDLAQTLYELVSHFKVDGNGSENKSAEAHKTAPGSGQSGRAASEAVETAVMSRLDAGKAAARAQSGY
jgi:methyl-accepting chemotaxis protein